MLFKASTIALVLALGTVSLSAMASPSVVSPAHGTLMSDPGGDRGGGNGGGRGGGGPGDNGDRLSL